MSVETVYNRIVQIRAMMPLEAEKRGKAAEETSFQTLYAGKKSEPAAAADAAGILPVYSGLTVTGVSSVPEDGTSLWLSTAPAQIEAEAAPYRDIIEDASRTFNVPSNIIMAIIKRESDYQVRETSYSGAMGLMQVMPFNAEDYGITDAYDPRQNIFCGTWELRQLLDMYNGDMKLAIAGYNVGCGTLRRLGVTSSDSEAYAARVPGKVQQYVEQVLRFAGEA